MAALTSDWLRHFRLLLWTEYNETWQEARSQRPLPSLCFAGRSVNKMSALADSSKRWHIVLRCTICGPLGLLLSIVIVILGPIEQQNGRPGIWLSERVFTSPLKLLNWIHWNLTGIKQDLNILYQVCILWAIRKTKMAALSSLSTKVAHHCTQVRDIWPFGPFVCENGITSFEDRLVLLSGAKGYIGFL